MFYILMDPFFIRNNMRKFLLFLLPLFFILFSCNREKNKVEIIGMDPSMFKEVPKDKEGYLKISIKNNSVNFREGGVIKSVFGNIESLTFLFFDGNEASSNLVEVKDFKLESTDLENLPPIRLLKGKYYLLCIANKTSSFDNLFQKGKTFEEIIKTPHRFSISNFLHLKGGKVFSSMMSNKGGLKLIEESDFSNELATASPVELELESMIASLNLDNSKLKIEDNSGVKLIQSDFPSGFTVVNVAKSVYLLRHTRLSTSSKVVKADNQTEELEDQYAYVSGYEEIATAGNAEIVKTLKSDYIANFATNKDLYEHLKSASFTDPKDNFYYIKESTIPYNYYWQSLVPHIVVAYALAPKSLDVTPNKGWISYKNSYMKEEDFVEFVENLKKDQNAPLNLSMQEGFREILLRNLNRKELTEMNAPFSIDGIKFYYKSLNYYAWPIRHFNNTDAPNLKSFGRYGLVRNTEYFIKVKSISWLGDNMPLNLANKDEELVERAPIRFSIKVVPADEKEQEVIY